MEVATEPCCSGVLTVSVVDINDDPIKDATVKVYKERTLLETASTDANGKALFDDLCKGEYSASVSKDGYIPREFEFRVNENCEPVSRKIELTQ